MRDSAAAGDGCVSFHPKHSGSISHIAGANRVSGLKGHLSAVGTLLKNRQKGAWRNVLKIAADCLCESDHGLNWTSAGAIYSHLSGEPAHQFGFLR